MLVPDLAAGETFSDAEEAREHLADLDADRLASLTLTAARLVREKAMDSNEPIAILGFSMGASLALWASARLPEAIGKVVAFYGVQSIDFAGSSAKYQLHLVDDDELVSDDEAAFMQATMGIEDLEVEVYRYPDVSHFFFERDQATHDEGAARLAWDRILEFLA